MTNITLHYRDKTYEWRSIDLKLRSLGKVANTTTFEVTDPEGKVLGRLKRRDRYVGHEVVDRIRYDFAPKIVWTHEGDHVALYRDTRNEVLAEMLDISRVDTHLANRGSQWIQRQCSICQGER